MLLRISRAFAYEEAAIHKIPRMFVHLGKQNLFYPLQPLLNHHQGYPLCRAIA